MIVDDCPSPSKEKKAFCRSDEAYFERLQNSKMTFKIVRSYLKCMVDIFCLLAFFTDRSYAASHSLSAIAQTRHLDFF